MRALAAAATRDNDAQTNMFAASHNRFARAARTV